MTEGAKRLYPRFTETEIDLLFVARLHGMKAMMPSQYSVFPCFASSASDPDPNAKALRHGLSPAAYRQPERGSRPQRGHPIQAIRAKDHQPPGIDMQVMMSGTDTALPQ